jgi:hypothetical protein
MQLGHVEVHVRSDEESGAETKEDDEIEGGFMTERKEPVPKWELLAEKRNGTSRTHSKAVAVWERFCKQLATAVGSW